MDAPKTGARCEFKTYHSIPKKNGALETKPEKEPFAPVTVSHAGGKDAPFALVIHRKFTDKYELESTTLTVNSPHLLEVFRHVVGTGYTTVASDFKTPFDLSSPFQMLMHYWDEFEVHQKETQDSIQRQHLKLLLDFMQHEMGPERAKVHSMVANGQINYLQAWVLFRPGDLLYTTVMGEPWLLRCRKTAYEISSAGPYIIVSCTYADHDGTYEGTANHRFYIFQKQVFGADNPAFIVDLPVYPRKFAKADANLEAKLAIRGRKFLDRKGVSIQAYDGSAQFLKEPPYDWYSPDESDYGSGIWLPFTETGRILLDRKTFQEEQYNSQVSIKVAEPDLILCPPFAIGYSLSRKDWCRFFIDKMKDVEWKQSMWDSLILSSTQKTVLQALVTSHTFPDNARDQPEQKGKGLVILLHGAPGSGKTLSAETAAEGSQRALISASLGELNRDNYPSSFEYRLKRVLQYATMWKAIVLLDEADVFLEVRQDSSQGDGKRNALVAVFLKELEYFSGIVFLTTNRLASFDAAMKSRIHLAMRFESPGIKTREKLWLQVLRGVPATEMGIDDVDEAVESVLQEEMNGREISNAVNTARTIARHEKERLQLRHIEMVVDVRHDFDKSLRSEARKLTAEWSGAGAGAGAGAEPNGLVKRGSIVLAADL